MQRVLAPVVVMAAACAPMRDGAPATAPLSYVEAAAPADPLAPRPAPSTRVVMQKLPPPPGAQERPPAPPAPFRSRGGAWPAPNQPDEPPSLEGVLMNAPLAEEPRP